MTTRSTVVYGDSGSNAVTGLGSAVSFEGRGGADILDGGGGSDTLDGGADADVIDGGDGNDRLIGGADGDTLTGGTGSDQFIYQSAADGGDEVTDWDNTDLIAFEGVLGLDALSDVTRAANGSDVLVTATADPGTIQITLKNVTLADVEDTDFVFS